MDYKKIIKSRKLRTKILDLLCFVPDEPMIKLQYRIKTGRKLNLTDPKRYTEKLQWYKLYYKNPLMIQCVDKFESRKYVESLGLGSILNECYGVYDCAEDVEFDKLPNQFVLKDTLGGGGNFIIICRDKSKADLDQYRHIMRQWVSKKRIPSDGREWPYYCGKKHRIIAEKLLEDDNGGLNDNKFYCFDGKVNCFYVRKDYQLDHVGNTAFFDSEGKYIEVGLNYSNSSPYADATPPEEYSKMIHIAERLSKAFPHVRIDLYCINCKIVFGEFTFYNASGYMTFDPDEFDFELGSKWTLPPKFPRGG